MPLEDYQKKRNFDSTSEPKAESVSTVEIIPVEAAPIKARICLNLLYISILHPVFISIYGSSLMVYLKAGLYRKDHLSTRKIKDLQLWLKTILLSIRIFRA